MMNKFKTLFISGMFRSGTTLLTRMLNTHKSITVASDPYAPIFKQLRNEVAKKIYQDNYDSDMPLDDYYFDLKKNKLFNIIQKINLNNEYISSEENYTKLKNKLKNHLIPYSPKLIANLDEILSKNFHNIFVNGFNAINNTYGNKNTKIVGFKEVWSNEFIPSLIKKFKDIKIIQIIRDPRAVVASNHAKKNEKYPLLFLCRQWRKMASLSYFYKNKYKNILNIKYEDLIAKPEIVSVRICKFLSIDFDENILDPTKFQDGENKKWLQNSNFGKISGTFNSETINKWKNSLSDAQIKIIETLCGAEMKLFNYLPNSSKLSELIHDNYIQNDISKNSMALWIRPYSNYDIKNELNMENERINYINKKRKISDLNKELYFLHKKVYSTVCR